MRCEPANTLITKLGGLTKVAKMAKITPNGVMRWRMPKAKGGTGGAVPHWNIPALMAGALQDGVSLTLADFYPSEHQHSGSIDAENGPVGRQRHEKSGARVSQVAAQ